MAPSTTPKMARTMAGAAHSKEFARKIGIPQSVAKEFNQADKGTDMLKKGMKEKVIEKHERDEGHSKKDAKDIASGKAIEKVVRTKGSALSKNMQRGY